MQSPFPPEHFARLDEAPDTEFYSFPRKVVHLDAAAIEAVEQFFRDTFPAHGRVLDLFSSWRSHWPPELPKQALIGLGLNDEEMADNPDLDQYVVQDVNATPCLPFDTDAFDAVVITVSIQYVTRPLELFREVHRLLKPGGVFAVIFSNRMFPTKAVAVWRALDDLQHADLIASYFHHAGGFVNVQTKDYTPARMTYTDPVYVVMAHKGDATAS